MERQVFQTDSRRRWRRFKWTMRFFATIFILLLAVFITMFAMEGSPNLPFRHDYRSAMTASKPFMKDNKAKFGTIWYYNNGGNVETFKVKVPVTVEYEWGKFTTKVEITINPTIGD